MTYKSGYEGPLKSQDNLSLLKDHLHFALQPQVGSVVNRTFLWAFFQASQICCP